jgi:hypothetical protein
LLQEPNVARPRRTERDFAPIPVAAEVLELRCLLSSTAAAVARHALHAADRAQSHHGHAATPAGFSYNGPIAGTLDVPAFSLSHSYAGTLVISKTTLQAGAAFKATLNIPTVGAVGGFAVGAITGSLSGKITNVVPQGSNQVITIAPKGGSLTAAVTFSHITVKPKLTPVKTTPMTLTIDSQGHIVSFSGTYHVPPVPPIFDGGDAAFTFAAS